MDSHETRRNRPWEKDRMPKPKRERERDRVGARGEGGCEEQR